MDMDATLLVVWGFERHVALRPSAHPLLSDPLEKDPEISHRHGAQRHAEQHQRQLCADCALVPRVLVFELRLPQHAHLRGGGGEGAGGKASVVCVICVPNRKNPFTRTGASQTQGSHARRSTAHARVCREAAKLLYTALPLSAPRGQWILRRSPL